MKTTKQFLFSFIALSGLLLITSCSFGSDPSSSTSPSDTTPNTNIGKMEANRQVLNAVNKMATTHIHSFELDLGIDVSYEGVSSLVIDEEDVIQTVSVDANVDLAIKANKLFGDNAEASIILDTSLNLDLDLIDFEDPVNLDLEAGISAYLKDGWAYVDLTDVIDVLTLFLSEMQPVEEEEPTSYLVMAEEPSEEIPSKLKYNVGNLSDLFELEDNFVLSPQPLDVDSVLPYFNEIRNVSAKIEAGGIVVEYEVTMDDLVDVFYLVSSEGEDNGGGSIDDAKDSIRSMLSSMVTITEAKITIGVGSDGYLNKFYIDVDVDVNINDEDESQTHSLDASLHLDIANINKTVSVSFPSDLNTYYELTEEDFGAIVPQ